MVMNNIGIVLEIWRTDNVMLSVDQCTKLLRMVSAYSVFIGKKSFERAPENII